VPETASIDLRPLELADAEAIASWALDPLFCAAAEWTVGLGMTEYVSFHRRIVTEPPSDLIRLAAVHQGELVGYVDLHGSQPSRRELGFIIGDSRRWKRGLGRQAAQAGLDYGFHQLKLTEIWAEALAANLASVRILQSLGMIETGPGAPGIYLGTPTHYRRFTISTPRRPSSSH
jgi:RimJ/RimL family protein N-acetyltransferase